MRTLKGRPVTVMDDVGRLLEMHGGHSQAVIDGCDTMIDEYPDEIEHWTQVKMEVRTRRPIAWRCLYCSKPLAEGEECNNERCQRLNKLSQRRMRE